MQVTLSNAITSGLVMSGHRACLALALILAGAGCGGGNTGEKEREVASNVDAPLYRCGAQCYVSGGQLALVYWNSTQVSVLSNGIVLCDGAAPEAIAALQAAGCGPSGVAIPLGGQLIGNGYGGEPSNSCAAYGEACSGSGSRPCCSGNTCGPYGYCVSAPACSPSGTACDVTVDCAQCCNGYTPFFGGSGHCN
jgi:hypothetical protein